MAPANDLIDGLKAEQVLADKAYDANSHCDKIEAQAGAVVIPPRRHRKQLRDYDRVAYKTAGASKASSPGSSSIDASQLATTSSPPTSSPSSNSPAS